MTVDPSAVRIPRILSSLVALFASRDEVEAILGDLEEEFTAITDREGHRAANRWYWRQAVRTIGHLAIEPFRAAPWHMLAFGVLGLVGSVPLNWAAGRTAAVLATRYPVYYYVPAPTFWTLIYLPPMFILGCIAARLSRSRPLSGPLAILLATTMLFFVVDPIALFVVDGGRTISYLIVRGLRGVALFALPMLVGGVVGASTLRAAR